MAITFRYLTAPYAWRVRDRHEHRPRPRRVEDPLDLVRTAEDGDALQAPPPQPRIVVDEPDHDLARCLAQLAQQAATGSSGADDQGAATLGATEARTEGPEGG